MTDPEIEELKQEADQRLQEYITLIEGTNDSLLTTLKQCVSLLSQFTDAVPNPKPFKELLEHLGKIIDAGEQVVSKKAVH